MIEVVNETNGRVIRSFEYTVDGYLESTTDADGTTHLRYSVFGELESVELPDGRRITYRHDVLGRRCERAVNGDVTHRYLWLGNSLLAVYDGSNELKMRFEYVDSRVPVAVWVYEGGLATRYFIAADQVGSIRAVFDEAGTVVKAIKYDSFGYVLNDSNASFALPLGFACGLTDPNTQFIRFGVRDYDPEVGRWTAREPLLFGDGLDAYAYCGGEPVNRLDCLGLTSQQSIPITHHGGRLGFLQRQRSPDYRKFEFNLMIPTPLTGPVLGATMQISEDRMGNVYLAGGLNLGKSLTTFSASGTHGRLKDPCPDDYDIEEHLKGLNVSGGLGTIVGAAMNVSPGHNTVSSDLGVYTPQIGISGTYALQMRGLTSGWK